MSKTIKLAKGDPISFKYTSTNIININDSEQVVADEVAEVIAERFGSYVSIKEAPAAKIEAVTEEAKPEIPTIDPILTTPDAPASVTVEAPVAEAVTEEAKPEVVTVEAAPAEEAHVDASALETPSDIANQ